MAILRSEPTIRPATAVDYSSLSRLISSEMRVHRHLDWKPPLDWLGEQPFLVAEHQKILMAALACPQDPLGVAWIRLYVASGYTQGNRTFERMLAAAQALFPNQNPPVIAAIAIQDWFERILQHTGFHVRQNIVVLDWNQRLLPDIQFPDGIEIRPLLPENLGDVCDVDRAAFEPIWHNSLPALRLAYQQSAWSTIAVLNNKIVGYQISTAIPLSGHLARLAVYPNLQQKGIGAALVVDVLRHFKHEGVWRVTVNTQDTNKASLGLYEKLGFQPTGEIFPVFVLE